MNEGPLVSLDTMEKMAGRIRATCVKMAHVGDESHLSSALSCVDILTALFGGWLKYEKGASGTNFQRDRFILSKGHGCSALYATLAAYGHIPVDTLSDYSCTDSPLPNHPCKFALPELEISSGSLGHGLGIATGLLYGARLSGKESVRAVVLMGDGECNEGSVWEAAMFAVAQRLHNLLAIVDNNGTQAVGRSDELMGFTSLEEKFVSFGWKAVTVNGNNVKDVWQALQTVPLSSKRPTAIIAKTVSGAGVSFMENDQVWFYRRPDDDDFYNAMKELKQDPIF